ncbi:ABC transporter permease [Jeotgalibaca dankookensis]|uniref:ABC transporter permease n=1 Tax=Jeotgalibaca dankookensis TaxID=708126 RepID=UPI0007824E77|nr:ABC transporter permease [Jeotgalibaca dankookensis]
MHKFWVIVGQVYKKNVKSFGFLTMILSPIILLGIIAAILTFVENTETEIPVIAVFSEMDAVTETIQNESEYFKVDSNIQSVAEAEDALAVEEIDGYLTVSQIDNQLSATYNQTPDAAFMDIEHLNILLSNIQLEMQASRLSLPAETITSLLTPPLIEKKTISIEDGEITEGDSLRQNLKIGAAYGISIAIFMFIMTYSSIIAEEIASEKGTRIMEVILSSVNATTHFFGKLVAIFLICLTQILAYLIIGLIAFQFDRVKSLLPAGVNLFETLKLVAGTSLYYFLMGISLYAVIAAFLGSLVSKIEDVSKAVTPIVFTALIGFYGGMFALVNTTHPIIKIGSHIPLFTPFIMPFRIAAETATSFEVGISMLVMFLFTIFVTIVSLILYRSNVLIYSDSGMFKTIKTSFRNIRNER